PGWTSAPAKEHNSMHTKDFMAGAEDAPAPGGGGPREHLQASPAAPPPLAPCRQWVDRPPRAAWARRHARAASSLTPYILALNKLIGENDVINARTLPKVQMPKRDNFIVRFPDRI